MKLYGMAGKGTGRVGSQVYAIRRGEQIVRQYNPIVANPNTRPQVEQRAKFKLLSQLTAAIGNSGLFFDNVPANRSMRNEFTRRNMGAVTVASGSDVATVNVSALELTSGSFPAPGCSVDAATSTLTVTLSEEPWEDVAGVTVIVLTQPELGRVIGYSQRVAVTDTSAPVSISLMVAPAQMSRTTVLVWVYKFRDDAARARYEQALMSSASISVAFDRAVASGDIVVSTTAVAPFQGA